MKKMLAGLIAITLTFTAMAQSTDKVEGKESGSHERRHFGKEQMEQLNLTEDQKTQMKAAKDDFRKKMDELKGNTGLTEEQKATQRKAIIEQQKAKINSILTADQQEKAKALRKEAHDQRKEGKDDRKERFDEMTKDLNLSADQSTKIKASNEKFQTSMKAIKDNSSLTQEQKKAQMKTLIEAHKTEIKAVLTAEQQAKMKEKMEARRAEKKNK